MSKNKELIAVYSERMLSAKTPEQRVKVLGQMGRIGLSHRALHNAIGAPPGYRFDEESGRLRPKTAPASRLDKPTVPATLSGLAEQSYLGIEHDYGMSFNKQLRPWRLSGLQGGDLAADTAVRVMKDATSPADRATVVRRTLALKTSVLASSNPRGQWQALPKGGLGVQSVVGRLCEPFVGYSSPDINEPPAVTWVAYSAVEATAAPIVVRSESLATVVHRGAHVQSIRSRGKTVERAIADRAFTVRHDAYLALEPDSANDLAGDTDFLELVYSSRGEGASDAIVPAASFLVVEQEVHMYPRRV